MVSGFTMILRSKIPEGKSVPGKLSGHATLGRLLDTIDFANF